MPTLRELARDADRVLVVEGAYYDPRHRKASHVLADHRALPEVDAALDALDATDSDIALMTMGRWSIVFLADRRPLALVHVVSPGYIRCHDVWQCDARLTDPTRLVRWLGARGLGFPAL